MRCNKKNNWTAACWLVAPVTWRKHCCFCSAHWLLLLWLREATFVDFEDVAGLGQSNHRCPSEVDQSASDIALAFQPPDWSVGSCHRKCKGVFPGGGSLSASKNFPEDAGELSEYIWILNLQISVDYLVERKTSVKGLSSAGFFVPFKRTSGFFWKVSFQTKSTLR